MTGGHPHPSVAGREAELAGLADAVRRLVRATVDHRLDATTTAALAAELEAVAADLAAHVPDPLPDRFTPSADPMELFGYDVVFGRFNPLALPVEVVWDDPHARGRGRFTRPYEGPPGCVHGAVIAEVFDQVCNVANISTGVPGPTRNLAVDYRAPTLLDEPIEVECRVAEVAGREVTTIGELRQGDRVTASCEGTFVHLF